MAILPYVVYAVTTDDSHIFWSVTPNLESARERAREAAQSCLHPKAIICRLEQIETVESNENPAPKS